MRSVSFWGKFTSSSRIRASRSDLLKLPNESLLGATLFFRGTKLGFRDNSESLLGAKHSFRGTKLGFRDTNESILEAKHSFQGTNIVSEDTNEMPMIQNEIQMPIDETNSEHNDTCLTAVLHSSAIKVTVGYQKP